MKRLVDEYLSEREFAWAKTTKRNLECQLRKRSGEIEQGPEVLWKSLQDLAPYSRVTVWTWTTKFYDWCLERGDREGVNPFAKFREENRQLFRNAYRRQQPDLSYRQARALVRQIPDKEVRQAALTLLTNGLRISEYGAVKDGKVVGKGGKERKLYGAQSGRSEVPEYRIRKALKEVGLKPHDLRKIFATELVRQGIDTFDLCRVMGWSDVTTALSYVSTRKDDELKKFVNKVLS